MEKYEVKNMYFDICESCQLSETEPEILTLSSSEFSMCANCCAFESKLESIEFTVVLMNEESCDCGDRKLHNDGGNYHDSTYKVRQYHEASAYLHTFEDEKQLIIPLDLNEKISGESLEIWMDLDGDDLFFLYRDIENIAVRERIVSELERRHRDAVRFEEIETFLNLEWKFAIDSIRDLEA